MLDNDVIGRLVTEIGKDGLDDRTVGELVKRLRREYPQNDAVMRIYDALGTEQDEERDENEFPWILFSLNGTAYGINSKFVLSIEILGEITPMVDSASYSPGITRSRGETISLLDIRALFGSGDYKSAKEESSDPIYMMVVAEIGEQKRGLIVDEIISVEHITRFEDRVALGEEQASFQYVSKIARREKTDKPVLVLNPDRLIGVEI